MNELVFEIVKCGVIVMAAMITIYLVPWIRSKTQGTKFDELEQWVRAAVQWAEQVFGSGEGKKKKEEVMGFIIDLCATKGIQITTEQIDKLIEASVWAIKQAKEV